MLLALGNARRLAAPSAQIIELGAPHLAAPHDLDGIDHRRVERENAFHPLAVGDLAHREILVEPGAGAPDAHALVSLDARALAFNHLLVAHNGIAPPQSPNTLSAPTLPPLPLFHLFNA